MADIIITEAELAPIRALEVRGPDSDGDYKIDGDVGGLYVYTGYIAPTDNLLERRRNALATLLLLEHFEEKGLVPETTLAKRIAVDGAYLTEVLTELGLKVVRA